MSEAAGEGQFDWDAWCQMRGGKALAVASVDVRNDDGVLVAMGTATYRLGAPGTPRRNED